MYVPLVLLAAMGIFAGYPFVAHKLAPAYHAPEHLFALNFISLVSLGTLIIGVVSGFVMYSSLRH